MQSSEGFIGTFDSGAGGISVLRHLVAELPHERFSYFGDSAHAPYGDKGKDEIISLSRDIVRRQLADGAKAIVIACNTATAAAAAELRREYPEVPIVGVEPALKPAVLAFPQGCILVMATMATLALEKYHVLEERWQGHAKVIPVACVGLVDLIERGDLASAELHDLVEHYVGAYRDNVDAVVLGCTHYPFIGPIIKDILGPVPLFDGGAGTARQLRAVLRQKNLLASEEAQGSVTFSSSMPGTEELDLYRQLFDSCV